MNSDAPKSPRQELEASLTALLLGELPSDKAAALRELMAKDAELARLYERLEQTIGLVRETAAPAEQGTQSAPKLSNKRREQLLAHFKTVAPKEFTKPLRREVRARELAIAAGIVAVIGVAAWFFNQESFSSMSRISHGDERTSARMQLSGVPASAQQSPVASVSDRTTARLAAEQGLELAQKGMVAPLLSGGGGGSGGSGSPSQTIFFATSAGKPIVGQVALPTLTDYYASDSSVQSSVSTNFIAGDPQWLGILERGNYSAGTHSSTNQFVSRYASIALPTNQLADVASLYYQPRVPVFVTNGTATNASEFAYYYDLNRNGAFDPQETFSDSTRSGSRSTGGFGRAGTSRELDEMSRRQSGGVASTDNMHQKNGNVALAQDSGQEFRRKLQGIINNAANTPVEQVPVIDPATGLPVAGAYGSGAIDPATGLPVPAAAPVAEAQEKMPTPVPLATRAFQVDTNAFIAAIEPYKNFASQMPSRPGGTGGGGGGGGPATVSEQLPQRTLRLASQTTAQSTASTPITSEKLPEFAQEGKDTSGSNIYLGKELAKVDVKFGTWGLDANGLPHETKKEEERLKQLGEVRDGVTTAGQGFRLMGPKEEPPAPSGVPVASQRVPFLGDLPVLGNAFKSAETKPGRNDNLSDSKSLSISGTNLQTWAGLLSGVMASNVSGDAHAENEWQFTTGAANLGWLGKAETNQFFATELSNELASSFYYRGHGTQANWARDFAIQDDDGGGHPLTGKELVTRQSMVDIEKDWQNPNSLRQTNPSQSPAGTTSNVYSLDVAGYSNLGHANSNLFADRLRETAGQVPYDRYTHYRELEQLGAEDKRETKLALSYSNVQDDGRKAAGKSSATETKETNVSVPSEFVSEVIPFKYAKASEIASALNSLSSGGSGGATVSGGTTTRSLTGTRATGGFGRTGTGANYGSPATRNSFTNRLRGIINRGANDGEIVVFGQTKMIADERSNSLLLYASRDDMKTIKDIIAKLDVDLVKVTDSKVAAKPVTSPPIPQPEVQTRYNVSDAMALADAPTMLMSAEEFRKLEGMRIELEAQVMREETQLDALKKMPREKLVASLPTAAPDTALNSLLEQKTLSEQALILKQRELGEASPEVARLRDQVSDLNSKIDKQTEGILLNWDGRVTAVKEQLSKLRDEVEKAKTNDIVAAQKAEPYWEAKRNLDDLQKVSQVLAMKMASESIEASLPQSTMVEILDDAVPAEAKKTDIWDRMRGRGKFESQARIKLDGDQSDADRRLAMNYDPYFIQIEFETIKSDKVLGKVVAELNLQKEWSKSGSSLTTNAAIALLKQKLDLKPVRNTSFVDIDVKSDKPEEAAKLANAIAKSYRDHRLDVKRELGRMEVANLEQRWKEQETKVASAQREVDRLRAELGIYEAKAAASQPAANNQIDAVPPKPAVPLPVPQPEIETRENAFSTFSLNVSDVAFKLAAASLEKGQMPEPAGIRSEEFINAFDYRDPEAPAGVPVAFAWERARYPYAQNRDLLRFSIKTAAQGRQAGRPLNLVLLLDNSGSMERADRVAIIREALKVLASQLQPQDKLSVITFARTAQLRVDGVSGNQAAQVAEDIGGLTPEGGTNIEEAMNLAYQTALRHYLANGINRVVLLTDGAANLGNVEPESLKQKVEANRKQGVALDCFGIGWEGFNDDLLETLSRNGDGRYGFINSPEEAATEFAGQLAGALNVAASDVKVQVEFNPARVTAYRQIGYAKHQLTKQQFRDNTVDAAEIAAQEAGNALYVVEVKPAGQGPLGTVRVRFKIPGTSDYREHEWTVPFNGNAVALEQASPAMRLAATASAFSEWLATSPYATEVTPDTLLSYLSGVPEVYGADARPKKLEWMIRQAKSVAGIEIRNSNIETRSKPEDSKQKDANRVQFP